MDFTTVISAPEAPLRELLVRIEGELLKAGLRHDHTILRAAYDARRGTFDEVSPDEEVRVRSGFDELPSEVSGWEGLSCEFWNESFTLYLLVGRLGHGAYVNVWVDISLRPLTELLANHEEGAFYGALATICAAVDAYGGYGHPELGFHPLAPERARTALTDMPEFPGESAMLGLLPADDLVEAQARQKYERTFTLRLSTQGYWILTQDLKSALVPS
ncbi:hypothetical protein QEG98_36760 [Myxococcus sp. MxC21-1]|uniref:hypothetical protein n=1 Tax=Myxococcus sp. MxC21-1 TaxID=3041439 RepID=UPI002931D80B|nr:hypothetical protein [Myxococcus sp. MxC21-1]WNZ61372.1 hypothetical protein QEG98_36760 [Myxococcus sp. MxC21-1]